MPSNEPNLTCPYTGDALVPVMDDVLGAWTTTGGADPLALFDTEEAARTALRTRKGTPNCVSQLKCPYTGAPLKVVATGNKFKIAGRFFSPRTYFENKQELLYELSIRNGKLPDFPRKIVVKVGEVLEQQSNPAEGLGGVKSTDLAEEVARIVVNE